MRLLVAAVFVGSATAFCPTGLHTWQECQAAGCQFMPPIYPQPGNKGACVECLNDDQCKNPTPACSGGTCQISCGSQNYTCQRGIRITTWNNRACPAQSPWRSAACDDETCCGACNGDGDCKDAARPHCGSDLMQCFECTRNEHCAKGGCMDFKCVPCEDWGDCSAPCTNGRFECELPCAKDTDCLSGYVCAVNPGEANYTHNAKRCQRVCQSNKDCKAFNNDVHSCIQANGQKFCGQCLNSHDCPNNEKCIPDNEEWGKCGETGSDAMVV